MTTIPHDQLREMTLAQLNAIVSDKTIASTDAATTSAAGLVELATDAEFDTGTDTARYASVKQIRSRVPLGFKNLLINGAFNIKQRPYASGEATTGANQYTLDRWRVVTSGEALSWTDSNGTRTVTAPAGGIEQVVEGATLQSGTYTIAWTGAATCTVGGTARANGEAFSITGGSNVTVKFINGTVANAQFELGSCATPFENRPYGLELALCQRYCYRIVIGPSMVLGVGYVITTETLGFILSLPVHMRVAPTVTLTNLTTVKLPYTPVADITLANIHYAYNVVYVYCSGTFSAYAVDQLLFVNANIEGGSVLFSAEL